MFKPIEIIRSLVSFFTIIPVGEGSLNEAADYFHFAPLIVGLTNGVPPAILVTVLSYCLRPPLPAIVSYTFYIFITGFHHFDGLMDFADALMAKGTREKRIEVLHDRYTGSAAVASVFLDLSLAFGVLLTLSIEAAFKVFIAASIFSVLAGVTASYLGPSMTGSKIGKIFIEKIKGRKEKIVFAFLYSTVIALLLGVQGVISLILSQAASLIVVYEARKVFGGLNGDVIGAIIELSRTASMFGFTVQFW